MTEMLGPLAFIGAAIVVIAVIALIYYTLAKRERKTSEAYARLAGEYEDGEFVQDTWGKRIVRLTHMGLSLELEGSFYSAANQNQSGQLEFRVNWPTAGMEAHLQPRNVINAVSAFFTRSRLLTDHPWLDRFYTITGSPKSELRDLFVRAAPAIMALDSMLQASRLEIELRYGVLRLKKAYCARDFYEIRQFLRNCISLLEAMSVVSSEGVEFIETEESVDLSEAVCKICGDRIDQLAVKCASCKTLHHHECWEYAGVCSTYGCGQTKYLTVSPALPVEKEPTSA